MVAQTHIWLFAQAMLCSKLLNFQSRNPLKGIFPLLCRVTYLMVEKRLKNNVASMFCHPDIVKVGLFSFLFQWIPIRLD